MILQNSQAECSLWVSESAYHPGHYMCIIVIRKMLFGLNGSHGLLEVCSIEAHPSPSSNNAHFLFLAGLPRHLQGLRCTLQIAESQPAAPI